MGAVSFLADNVSRVKTMTELSSHSECDTCSTRRVAIKKRSIDYANMDLKLKYSRMFFSSGPRKISTSM